eukprot:TRINITY_DN8156_c0_g1_i1.p1 TRINITY_DN8156_c0_g1~~TRINITY_DN8156_c0_g1_i1.p1  ORF type:complete len:347 (+),score=38.71 TRINITY_DN8156_c0_g1_i1:24-1043(+)
MDATEGAGLMAWAAGSLNESAVETSISSSSSASATALLGTSNGTNAHSLFGMSVEDGTLLAGPAMAIQWALDTGLTLRQAWWGWMMDTFGEYALYSYIFWVAIVLGYLVLGGVYGVIDYTNIFHRWKIQQNRPPKGSDYWRCLVRLFFNYTVIILPLSFLHPPMMTFLGVQTSVETLPPTSEVLGHLAIFLVLEDFLHYVFHRILHWAPLYKRVHKVHHHHKYPFGLTAAYASPIEVLLLAVPTYSGPVLFAPHLSTIYLWILVRELDSIDTHSGYHFPFHPASWIPFWGAAPFHDYHHEVFTCNYASRFTFWDHVLRTYHDRDTDLKTDRRQKTKKTQ